MVSYGLLMALPGGLDASGEAGYPVEHLPEMVPGSASVSDDATS